MSATRPVPWHLLGSIGLIFGLLGGCFIPESTAKPKGQMTWAVHFTIAPTFLEPADNNGITSFLFLYAIHDALVKPMPGNQRTASLAESWRESDDGLTYEFTLRQGVTFHNGDLLTAEDVKFSFDRYRGQSAALFREKVKTVDILDPLRVRFSLKEPWPDFMTFYSSMSASAGWVVPKKYIERVGDDGFKKHPIGAGPYKFVSQKEGVELVLEAYEGYWRKMPHVKTLVMRSIPEDSTRLAMLKTGEADIAYAMMGPMAEEVKRDPKLTLAYSEGQGIFFIYFNEQANPKSPWHDLRVRQALNYAIDRQALSDQQTLGASPPTGNIVPRAFEFALPIEAYPYNPQKAKQLLTEAGYPNGFDAGEITSGPPYHSLAEGVANYLQAVGIRIKMRPMERAALISALKEKKLTGLTSGGSGILGNAATRLEPYVLSWGEFARIGYPDIDELYKQQSLERDYKKRQALLHQIQRLMHERAMYAPLYELVWPNGVGPRVAEAGFGLIPHFFYTGPYEDIRLRE
ncbi:MAG: ABC transporter substrate-binding protein [Candidatus Tectomicrobia bacterium]|uniref:ABC transporter substrate-binding protein n=1 Tax=Tectimicrobiota bacterium TaxID=2528274 RepID=A0A937VZZ6_UNCTE|nr:ABC transporter substrate-binding protein [Candidatus Tectomicrobia bacterium]